VKDAKCSHVPLNEELISVLNVKIIPAMIYKSFNLKNLIDWNSGMTWNRSRPWAMISGLEVFVVTIPVLGASPLILPTI
jgi:hypothetical protein